MRKSNTVYLLSIWAYYSRNYMYTGISSSSLPCAVHVHVDGLVVCHLPYGPTASFSISNTVMRHDIPDVGTMSEAFPHLIFHNFKTKLGERVSVCVHMYV